MTCLINKMYELKYFAFIIPADFSRIVLFMLYVKPLKGKPFAIHVLNLITPDFTIVTFSKIPIRTPDPLTGQHVIY